MNPADDRLYDLLPLIHRMRDAERGQPLRELLRVIGAQAGAIERDIDRLYDNWFIETCDDWVVPYIGDLLGYTLLPEAATLGANGGADRLGRVLAPRADVANTIAARRRKGTLSLLEDLARDAAGWPARAVEFYRLLGRAQHLDHLQPGRGAFADLRDPGALELLRSQRGAFDPFAHAVDVRLLSGRRSGGRYNIPQVGLFVFRLRSFPVTRTPAYCAEENGPHCYTFSALGNDAPLFQRLVAETDPTDIAQERNLPVPLRRHRFAQRGEHADYAEVSPELYGEGRSVVVYAPDWPRRGEGMPVPRELLVPADLSGWRYQVPRGRLAVDPERGRLLFPASQRPKRGVWVSYQYGFAGNIGGGEYPRVVPELEGAHRFIVHSPRPGSGSAAPAPGHFASVADALEAWTALKDRVEAEALDGLRAEHADDAPGEARRRRPRALIVELADSGIHEGRIDLQLEPGEAIQIRAAEGARPVLRLLDLRASHPDALTISGRAGSRVLLDGLLVTGRGIEVQGPYDDAGHAPGDDLCELLVRHCTLVPGWTLKGDCDPRRPNEPSIALAGTGAALRVEHSILGSIAVASPARRGEPAVIRLSDSILDATGRDRVAVGSPDEIVAHAEACFDRCSVIGETRVRSIVHAQDSIFAGTVRVLHRQRGCMRFCYVPPHSRTPRRFQCQPDLALSALPRGDRAARANERRRVRPRFVAARYGSPHYLRLADACCDEIRTGASDRSAMGAWHHLYEPQREANLAARLEESVPAGIDAGIIFSSQEVP